MNWRQAFIRQAKSEHAVRRRLNGPGVEYSHRLHYLQMVTEKLAKGFQANPSDRNPPPTTHHALVRLLQQTKGRPDLRRLLGHTDAAVFRSFIDSLLDLADQIERLAPSAASTTQPNPEYPWRDQTTDEVVAPVDYDFPLFDPRDPRMIKFERLLDALVRIAS